MSRSFYIYLPSNSRGENNTTSSFSVQLPKKLEFNSEWQVGLVSIIYPNSWWNMGTDQHQYIDVNWHDGGKTRLYLPRMIFKNFGELANALDSIIREGAKKMCDMQIRREEEGGNKGKREIQQVDGDTTDEEFIEILEAEVEDPESYGFFQVGAGDSQQQQTQEELNQQLQRALRAAQRAWNNMRPMGEIARGRVRELEMVEKEIQGIEGRIPSDIKTELSALCLAIKVGFREVVERDIQQLQEAMEETTQGVGRRRLRDAKRAADKAKALEKSIGEKMDKTYGQFMNLKTQVGLIKGNLEKEDAARAAAAAEAEQNSLVDQARDKLLKRLEVSRKRKQRKREEEAETRMANAQLEAEMARARERSKHVKVSCKKFSGNTEYSRLPEFLSFTYDQNTQRFSLHLNTQYIKSVQLSRQLNYLLGFSAHTEHQMAVQIAEYVGDLRGGVHSLYIYSKDLVAPSIIGDTTAPLLRILTIKGSPGDLNEEHFLNPQYFRLVEKNLTEISIEVRTSSGKLVPFIFGDIILTLHFKKLTIL